MCIVDIEKAFDGVPRKMMKWVMRKKEVIARAAMRLCCNATMKVRVRSEFLKNFLVQVALCSYWCLILKSQVAK